MKVINKGKWMKGPDFCDPISKLHFLNISNGLSFALGFRYWIYGKWIKKMFVCKLITCDRAV